MELTSLHLSCIWIIKGLQEMRDRIKGGKNVTLAPLAMRAKSKLN